MSGPAAGVIAFLCLFSAAIVGAVIQARLPAMAARGQANGAIRRGVWMIAIMAGIMLAAMTVYLKFHFDTANRDVRAFSFQIVDLDSGLRRMGPQAEPARALLFRYAARTMKDVWPESQPRLGPDDTHASRLYTDLETAIARMQPLVEQDRSQLSSIRQLMREVGRARWTLDERAGRALSPWTVTILVLWLMVTFGTLGMSTERSRLALGMLAVCALALAGAVFLAVEYADPYQGVIMVSGEPMRDALFSLSD